MLKIGAAYIRVSDERQDEYSPDSQIKKIMDEAQRDGFFIPDEYIFYDDGISGRSVKKRNDFNRMIAMAKEKNPPFERIYVWKFSRFARNQEESLVYKNLLKKRGISVKSVSETIPEGIYGSLIERIIEWMDEFYSINLATEVIRGMDEKFSRGEPTNDAPFGYIMKDKKFIPDYEGGTAYIVQDIFNRFLNGENLRGMARTLTDMGIRTKQGTKIENRWISYVLNNPVYVGKIRRSKDGKRDISKRDFSSDNIIVNDGVHEPIITMDVWKSVQEKLKQQKKAYPKHARTDQPVDYMLKGLVRCSNCGATLVATAISNRSVHRSVQCHNYSRGTCKVSHSIILPKIEEAFIEGLEQIVKTQSFTITPTEQKQTEVQIIDYDKMIEIELKKLERAKNSYLNGIDTMEQYKANKERIEADITNFTNLKENALKQAKNGSKPSKEALTKLTEQTQSIIDFLKRDDATPKAKNELLRTIISHIVYDKPNSHLAIYFHSQNHI